MTNIACGKKIDKGKKKYTNMVKKNKNKVDEVENAENLQEKQDYATEELEPMPEELESEEAQLDQECIEENKVEQELAELKDKHIRLHAEFDNFRRRTLKEKSDLIKTGGESTLINLLPVIDDLERALESINTAKEIDAVKEGIELIVNKFQNFLKQNGVQEIAAKELDFDTDKHEAITKFPAPTPELKGKVIDVVQKGYELHEKVIRFAKVVVGE